MKPTYTPQIVLRMMLDDLGGFHMFSEVFILFLLFLGCGPYNNNHKIVLKKLTILKTMLVVE